MITIDNIGGGGSKKTKTYYLILEQPLNWIILVDLCKRQIWIKDNKCELLRNFSWKCQKSENRIFLWRGGSVMGDKFETLF